MGNSSICYVGSVAVVSGCVIVVIAASITMSIMIVLVEMTRCPSTWAHGP